MKTDLFENVGLFQEDPSLLSLSEYEVRSRVPESVFATFVRGIEGYSVTLSEDILEPFRALEQEFQCNRVSLERIADQKTGKGRVITFKLVSSLNQLQTLNLHFEGKRFPVVKTDLLENVGLFQENPSLLGISKYEVKSRVPESVFAAFLRGIEGHPVTLS
jgi:hypothetical protein